MMQVVHEQLVADTNASVDDLTKEVTTKTETLVKAKNYKINAEGDLASSVDESEGLASGGNYQWSRFELCNFMFKQVR